MRAANLIKLLAMADLLANGVWHWRFVGRIGIDGVVILKRLSCLA
jgi:hypothetical protein